MWNRWRELHPDLTDANVDRIPFLPQANVSGPDLSGASLSEANLVKADLSKADLRDAFLDEADLSNANLSEAYLAAAHLPWARLYYADLRGAALSGASFMEANLSGANGGGADLGGAGLHKANLSRAHLGRAILSGASLTEANLSGADLTAANLSGADLTSANLSGANPSGADLTSATLSGANLSGADLSEANVSVANLSRANLSGAKCIATVFTKAIFVETILDKADLTGARIYGISAWDLQLTDAVQRDLIITHLDAPSKITVDDVEVAQLIYLLLNNNRVRKVIDTITSKVVLILGRFTPERKAVLDAVRDELRKRGYLPVVFDFDKPSSRDLTETVSTLTHMAKFVIADLTDAKSIPQELTAIVPFLLSVPVQPILLASKQEWGMYGHFPRYPWVLPTARYETTADLLANLAEQVPSPSTAALQSHERGARRDRKMDGGESEGVRWALVGDIRRSDAGSGRH